MHIIWKIPLLIIFFLLLACFQAKKINNAKLIEINKEEVKDLKKASMFLDSKLREMEKGGHNNQRPHHKQYDNYTLFLAVKNYARRLYSLQMQVEQVIQEQYGTTLTSLLNLKNFKINIPGLGKMKEDLILENTLYHNQYSIDLTKLLLIQDAPELAITSLKNTLQHNASRRKK